METATNAPLGFTGECLVCKNAVTQEAQFCSQCGFPLKGTEEEMRDFAYQYDIKRDKLEEANSLISRATTTLYWTAGLIFLGNIALYATSKETAYLIVAIVISVLFLGLAFWSKKKPFLALVTALTLFITIILADGIADLTSLLQGIIVKVIVIVFLVKGVKSARAAQLLQEELQQRNWNQ